ncbi:MAG: S-adenosylmethionine:tRNA ribosyltransferase-isomerase [Candidatus Aminicenantes bacterium]|nr:S-adenosylmethionine:tRNA ribosyltransferase-isomerase [Candidatus Aminicenantes bacterium]
MKLKDFFFDLPEERIAKLPAEKRDESKLMIVERLSGKISHHLFKDINDFVGTEDFLVVNNSRVIPVRLFGRIGQGQVEILIVKNIDSYTVEALTLPARKFKKGTKVVLSQEGPGLWAEVIDTGYRGRRTLRFNKEMPEILENGYAPLPPYIKRKFPEAARFRELDLERYQTIYAGEPGSIAAPTAGLHFTPGLLAALKKKCRVVEVTLNVGEATFQKIEVEDIAQHRMGREYITIKKSEIERIEKLKQSKNLIAVGTTSVRSLETYARLTPGDAGYEDALSGEESKNKQKFCGGPGGSFSKAPPGRRRQESFYSELFISPGFEFKLVDKLITNFHLPESSLFILTSAFGGLELMKEAYRVAIENKYRFFSYGDAMFII